MPNLSKLAVVVASIVASTSVAPGATVTLDASLDNTLYEDAAGGTSNGLGPSIFAGQTRFSGVRRALLKFDLSSLPAGATITEATLTLHLTRGNTEANPQFLHRVLAPWGEGTSSTGPDVFNNPGGSGDFSTAGDATWIHSFFPGTNWTNAGGDFDPTVSAGTIAGDVAGPVVFAGSGIVSDLQGWQANPSTNHGWLIKGLEGGAGNAKRFGSRENEFPNLRPSLTITFTPPPCVGDLNGDKAVNTIDLTLFLGAFGSTVTPGTGADLNNDGAVNTADLVIFLARFGQAC